MTDFRALCVELVEAWDSYGYADAGDAADRMAEAVKAARALLAEPVAEGPSADEWDALVKRAWDEYETVGYLGERFMYDSDFCNALDFVRRELARWGRPAVPPMPAGEGLFSVCGYEARPSMTTSPFSEFNAKPPGELSLDEITIATVTTVAARVENTIPVGYRLVTKDDGNGNTIFVLQGYFTWTQGWNRRGGEWRDLKTQESLYAEDYVPFGPLFSNNSKGSVE